MNESVDDVNNKRNRSGRAGTSDDVCARHNALTVWCGIKKCPRQTGVVHRIEIDHKVDSVFCFVAHGYLLAEFRFMMRVRSSVRCEFNEHGQAFIQVAVERDGDVRSPEGRYDLEPSLDQTVNSEHDQ